MHDASHHDGDKRYRGAAERLRRPERLALLEVPAVVERCLAGEGIAEALDVGTGTGIFAEAFAARGVRAEGVDVNAEFLAEARRIVPTATFREGTMESLPYGDASFDLVFLGHVLHETADLDGVLREMHRVARRRVGVLEWPYLREEQGPPFDHRLPPETLEAAAAAAGFGIRRRERVGHMELWILE